MIQLEWDAYLLHDSAFMLTGHIDVFRVLSDQGAALICPTCLLVLGQLDGRLSIGCFKLELWMPGGLADLVSLAGG